jgi:integrase
MSYHARLAVSIAALAPKLRLKNILELEWDEHLDRGFTTITVWDHKTVDHTGAPLVTPSSEQLRTILKDARTRHPRQARVVTYHSEPVESIRGAIRGAAADVGIPYGRFKAGGVTFHTLRHTAATILARLNVNPWLGRDVIGHEDLETTEGYTHLQLEEQRPVLEQLSTALPIAEIVMRPQRRASRKVETTAGAPTSDIAQNSPKNVDSDRPSRRVLGRPFARKAK